jgi:hypothetical protein
MEQHLIDLIHNAKRWTDEQRDYLPTLGCSSCGKGCMPLCGLGLNRKITPMETKPVFLHTRKSMMETGKSIQPMQLQFVTGTDVVIMCENALDSIQEREVPGKGSQWVFTKPIPTMTGLLCKECRVCMLCRDPTQETVRCKGKTISLCVSCMQACEMCQQIKVKHHICCARRPGFH